MGFETSQDLMISHVIGYWNRALLLIFGDCEITPWLLLWLHNQRGHQATLEKVHRVKISKTNIFYHNLFSYLKTNISLSLPYYRIEIPRQPPSSDQAVAAFQYKNLLRETACFCLRDRDGNFPSARSIWAFSRGLSKLRLGENKQIVG